jgi:hypothetical protein
MTGTDEKWLVWMCLKEIKRQQDLLFNRTKKK